MEAGNEVEVQLLSYEAQSIEEVLPMKVDAFLSFEKAMVGAAVLTLEVEGLDAQKVSYALLPFDQEAVVGDAVLRLEVEVQKVDAAVLSFEKGILWVVDGMEVLEPMDEDCFQICSCLAVSQSHQPSQLS